MALLMSSYVAAAETVTVSDPRPVDAAVRQLQSIYGWPITYEDLPVAFEADIEDVTTRVRKDGKSADEPGVLRILVARTHSFYFMLGDRPVLKPGTRAPEELARAAITEMLKSYSESTGGATQFALTDSNGIFHIVPTRGRNRLGEPEPVSPILDTVVTIPPGQRTAGELISAVCRTVAAQTGVRIDFGEHGNLLRQRITQIASLPNESVRSILSRLFAEIASPQPVSWALLYQPGWDYTFNVRVLWPATDSR